ncbi:MAG: polysulfide reductase NrfD [Nitrospiraceae bacterium]|nr:polysulfide reductase NrfD [Nitrospiraceae bacterium]
MTPQFLENPVWGLPIVIYPFFSGLVAGSFVVASLSQLFGLKKFEPVVKLAAILSFSMLLVAALAPLVDSLQPSRAIIELYLRDHFPYSALGVFIIVWTLYVILMVFEIYYVFRPTNVQRAGLPGLRGSIAGFLTFGNADLSGDSRKRDKKALAIIAAIGVVLAFIFHGYVGFIFGAIKARALWSDPLMPILFITSALVSGMAFVILAYVIGFSFYSDKGKVDTEVLDGLGKYLLYAIFFDLFLDLIECLFRVRAYSSLDVHSGFARIFGLGGPLAFNYLLLQLMLGLIVPAVLLTRPAVRRSKVLVSIVSALVLIGVYEMRYDTVIGGQLLPKIGQQGLVVFDAPWIGPEGILSAIGLFGAALVALFSLGWLLGWENEPESGSETD